MGCCPRAKLITNKHNRRGSVPLRLRLADCCTLADAFGRLKGRGRRCELRHAGRVVSASIDTVKRDCNPRAVDARTNILVIITYHFKMHLTIYRRMPCSVSPARPCASRVPHVGGSTWSSVIPSTHLKLLFPRFGVQRGSK